MDVQQIHPLVFQPLARMDRRKRQQRVRCVLMRADGLPQCVQTGKKRLRRRLPRGKHLQDEIFSGIEPPFGHKAAVAQRAPDRAHQHFSGQRLQLLKACLYAPDAFAALVRKPSLRKQAVQNRRARASALHAGGLRRLLGDQRAEFIVDAQKALRVVRRCGEAQDVLHVADDAVGKERVVKAAAAVRKPGALQRVDERKGAVVVSVQDGKRRAPLPCQRQQVSVLRLPGGCVRKAHPAALRPCRADGFGVTIPVPLDECARQPQNFRRGAVIVLQQQRLCTRPDRRKAQQRLRIGRAEAIDALILVADHEEVPGFLCQQLNDRVLHAGRVLRFVDAEIGVARLKLRQNFRLLSEDRQRVGHLVVVIHLPRLAQRSAVVRVKLRKARQAEVLRSDLVRRQHHIFTIGDRRAHLADGAVGWKVPVQRLIDAPDQRGKLAGVFLQRKRRAALPSAGLDDLGRQAVDRAELRRLPGKLREARGKARAKLPCGGDGVGHGQNMRRVDAAAQRHIPQPRHQHRRFPASGHGQQQDRPLRLADGGLLLFAELRHIAGGKFLRRHTVSSSTTGQWSLPNTSVRISDDKTRGSRRSETIK